MKLKLKKDMYGEYTIFYGRRNLMVNILNNYLLRCNCEFSNYLAVRLLALDLIQKTNMPRKKKKKQKKQLIDEINYALELENNLLKYDWRTCEII